MQNKKTSFFLQLFQYPFRSSPLFHLTPTFTISSARLLFISVHIPIFFGKHSFKEKHTPSKTSYLKAFESKA